MAKKRKSAGRPRGSATRGRASAEAVAKRRASRQLNALFAGGRGGKKALDGRTEKRRLRLIAELQNGRRGTPLKAIQILGHAQELLELGETIGSLKKAGVKPLRVSLDPAHWELIEATQAAYGFRPEAWKLLGVDLTKRRKKRRGR